MENMMKFSNPDFGEVRTVTVNGDESRKSSESGAEKETAERIMLIPYADNIFAGGIINADNCSN